MKEWILWNCVNYDDGFSFLKKQKYIFFCNGDFCENCVWGNAMNVKLENNDVNLY